MIQKVAAVAASLQQCTRLCIMSCAECFGETANHQVTQPSYRPDLAPFEFWLLPKLKSSLKGKRFRKMQWGADGN